MEKLRPNSEMPQFRRLNQALALYIKSALDVVPLTQPNANRNMGEKQTIDFVLRTSDRVDFVYFYYWPRNGIRPPDEEDIFFIEIEYRDQYKDINGNGLAAQGFSFTLDGQTTPQIPNLPADYELIDYSLSELNKKYPFYFPNFRDFELEVYRESKEGY